MRTLDRYALAQVENLTEVGIMLRGIPSDDPYNLPAYVVQQIEAGRYKARWITRDGRKVGVTVYTVDDTGGHRELVSIATIVERGGPPARVALNDRLTELAREENCQTIRMHTCRAGLVRAALGLGYHVAEIVVRRKTEANV